MKVFPILDDFSGKIRPYCVFSDDIPSVLSFYGENGDLLSLRVSADPYIEGTFILLDSAVSGGTYRDFLNYAMNRWNGQICLYLHRSCYRFPLPCMDGMGTPSEIFEASNAVYSALFCANLAFSDDGNSVIMFEDDRSLREKYEMAEKAGIPLLIAEKDVLDKIKAPCAQGAFDICETERDQ